jgi:hypothetical protein
MSLGITQWYLVLRAMRMPSGWWRMRWRRRCATAVAQCVSSPRFNAFGIGSTRRVCEEHCSTIIVGLRAPAAAPIYLVLCEEGAIDTYGRHPDQSAGLGNRGSPSRPGITFPDQGDHIPNSRLFLAFPYNVICIAKIQFVFAYPADSMGKGDVHTLVLSVNETLLLVIYRSFVNSRFHKLIFYFKTSLCACRG